MPDKEQRSTLVALIDLDGTLADYDGAMERDLKRLASPDETINVAEAHRLPHLRARVKAIRAVPGWWRNLERLPYGFKVLDLLRKYNFCLNILTKGPYSNAPSWTEKVEWCREHVPDATITISEDKSIVYGKILFDDWPQYITAWLRWRPRGLVIMPAHYWNRDFEHPQVIRYTGENLDEVEIRITELLWDRA